jgi:hypothetical protein
MLLIVPSVVHCTTWIWMEVQEIISYHWALLTMVFPPLCILQPKAIYFYIHLLCG